jgi:hypothetical protein
MREGRNQYAPMQGRAVLRQAIAAKFQELYGAGYDPDTEVTVTSGAPKRSSRRRRIVHPGDEAIVVRAVLRLLRAGHRRQRRRRSSFPCATRITASPGTTSAPRSRRGRG